MLHTEISKNYALKAPIISAGMAFVATPPLAAAVSNAGGMGMLGAAMVPPEGLKQMIQSTRTLTAKPFGVDFISEFVTDEHIQVCITEKVAVVVFFWSFPKQIWVERLQANGIRVWMEVGSISEANQARELGVDAIVAQGKESGGHNKAEASTFSLLPAICQTVAPIPVIAAGGIIDGKSLVAALSLGAEAVWCGTRFLTSLEANAHSEYKTKVLDANVGDTVRTTLFGPEWPGQNMRVIRNRVVKQWAGKEAEAVKFASTNEIIGSTIMDGQTIPLPKFSTMLPTPETTGDFEEMALTAGESSGNITELKPAGEIVKTMLNEAKETIQSRLSSLIISEVTV
ncbi:NAD(P)H-dependent flavin oxidoreductase [Aerosakkonemataceae cyanobacterium BLCC-F154]|uniref:NAD(P)H-dependent flavin oxidoreductase n=1 Tax=Floridaenema fluviatile BLCC-F154 TaxID=3153640 RepID=A0ABV4Y7T4_9CYAN